MELAEVFLLQLIQVSKLFVIHVLVFVIPFLSSPFDGKGLQAVSGDEIHVQARGRTVPVRLYGIDCPGEHQKFGEEARLYVERRIKGKPVRIQPLFEDPYRRLVAWVSVQGRSLNRELLEEGLAWWYRKYVPFSWELANLERSAHDARKGLWSDPHRLPPWKFRAPKESDGIEIIESPWTWPQSSHPHPDRTKRGRN
jgi:micrococcal nuclease